MTQRSAKAVLEKMNPSAPIRDREDFVELLAAFTVMYPDDMDVKADSGYTVHDLLINACDPGRIEWYMNAIRIRSRLSARESAWLGSGTTKNEQSHSVMNSHFRRTTSISKRLLDAQVQVLMVKEMLTKLAAIESKPTRKYAKWAVHAFTSHTTAQMFTADAWSLLLSSEFKPSEPSRAEARPKRIRPAAKVQQKRLWEHIHSKKTHGKRPRVFA